MELNTLPVPLSLPAQRKDFELGQLQSKMEDEQSLFAQLQKKMKELQVGQAVPV